MSLFDFIIAIHDTCHLLEAIFLEKVSNRPNGQRSMIFTPGGEKLEGTHSINFLKVKGLSGGQKSN